MNTNPGTLDTDNISPDDLTAADLAVAASRTCSPFSTVTEAVLVLKDDDCDMVPVVDEGKPVGLVTDRDVALAVADRPELGALPVSEIMSRELTSVPRDTPFDKVIKTMISAGAQTLFVVDNHGLLEGLICWSDLARRVPIGVMTGVFESVSTPEVNPL
jgi:predicted transcriptional regulator